MKDFNQDFAAEMAKTISAPVTLMVFHFGAGDVYVSDRKVTPPGGPSYEGLVVSWSGLTMPYCGPNGIGLTETGVEISDTGTPRFSSYLEFGVPEKTQVDVYQWFEGLAYASRELLGTFVIASPMEYGTHKVRLGLVSSFILNNRTVGKAITEDAYPNADPDAVGEVENIVYGRVSGVGCHAVDAGGVTALAGGIDAAATSVDVSLSPGAPSFPAPPFTVQCASERMRVTGVSGGSWTVTRGYDGTAAAPHNNGKALYEIRGSYKYLVAGHPVKSIGDVYVDGTRVVSGVTKNTDDSGKATVSFSDKFVLEKSVGLSVDDGIGVTDPGHYHGLGQSITKIYGISDSQSVPYNWSTTGNRSSVDDSVEDGAAYRISAASNAGQGYVSVGFPAWNGPTPLAVKLCCRYMWYTSGAPGSGLYVKLGGSSYGGTTLAVNSPTPSVVKLSAGTSCPSTVYFSIKNNGSACWADLYEIWLEVTTDATASTGAGVGKTGTVLLTGDSAADYVIGRRVSSDVEGYKDDQSGSYTGTPGALIENPADVLAHILVEQMGMPPGQLGSTFAVARQSLGQVISGGYAFGGVIEEPTDAFRLIEGLSAQSRLRLSHDGIGARLYFYETGAPQADVTIAASGVLRGSISIRRTGREEVINRLVVHYGRDYSHSVSSAKGYLKAVDSSATYPEYGDPASLADYGPCTPTRPVLLSFVADRNMASDIRDFTISRYKDASRRIRFTCLLDRLDVEPGDVVEFGSDLAAYGIDGAKFEVEQAGFRPGSKKDNRPDTVDIRAREV